MELLIVVFAGFKSKHSRDYWIQYELLAFY
jgi:hypothetical protein